MLLLFFALRACLLSSANFLPEATRPGFFILGVVAGTLDVMCLFAGLEAELASLGCVAAELACSGCVSISLDI